MKALGLGARAREPVHSHRIWWEYAWRSRSYSGPMIVLDLDATDSSTVPYLLLDQSEAVAVSSLRKNGHLRRA